MDNMTALCLLHSHRFRNLFDPAIGKKRIFNPFASDTGIDAGTSIKIDYSECALVSLVGNKENDKPNFPI